MEPLVSILIPAFNSERWIAETIQSALGQTWPRKEIIVVDDGSNDGTLAIAKRFVGREVQVVTQPNQGASAARNLCCSLCQGDYIQWLDADDLLAPDKVSQQMKAVEDGATPRTLLSSAWGRFQYRPDRAEFRSTSLWADLSPVEWLLFKLKQNLYMQTATWLVSRELTEAAGPWDSRLSLDDDGEYFCRVLLASEKTRFIGESKVYYRNSSFDSLSHIGLTKRKLESQFLSMQLHVGYLRSLEESQRVSEACLLFLQGCLVYFYPERLDLVEQAERLANDLGGHLAIPRLPRQYAWIQKVFGWTVAKRAQLFCNQCKSSVMRSLDGTCLRLQI